MDILINQAAKKITLIIHYFFAIFLIITSFSFCTQTNSMDDLDPSKPLGFYLQLYPFFLPPQPSAKEIKYFSIPSTNSYAIINGTRISLTVPFGTNTSRLTQDFFHTGISIRENESNVIPNSTETDFSSVKNYKVRAMDDSEKNYRIELAKGTATSKEILNFQFDNLDARGVITGTSIVVNIPFGTELGNLAPTFSHSGKSVFAIDGGVVGSEQIPRQSTRNFSGTVSYRVFANNDSSTDYTVVTTIGSNDSNSVEAAYIEGIRGSIIGNTIYFVFPEGRDLSSLSIILSHLGQSVRINNQLHINGETLYDLRNSLGVEVLSQSGIIRNYTIRAGLAVSPNSITPSFTDNLNETITDNNTGLVWMRCILSNVPGVPRTGDWCVDTTIGNYGYCNSATNDCNGGNSIGLYGNFQGGSSTSSNTAWRACDLANSTPAGGFGGRTNWRVPTLSEFQTIIDYEGNVNQSGFAGKPFRSFFPMGSGSGEYNFYHWTASTFAVGNTLSYRLWGTTGAVSTENKTTAHAVRCVSSNQ